MNLVKLEILAKDEKVFKGSFDIYAIDRDDNKKEAAKDVSIKSLYTLDLPKDTVSVSLVASPGSVFYGQGFDAKDIDKNKIIVRVYSNFKDEKSKGILEDEMKNNSVESIASGSGVTSIQKAKDRLYLQPVDRDYKIGKEVVELQPAYHVGAEVTFKIKAWLGNLYDGDKNDIVRIVDLLPEFTEYVENSVKLNKDDRKIVKNKEPKVIENYKGTGKTALIWEFGPLENNTGKLIKGFMHTNYYNIDFNYKIKINKGANGELQNAAYLGFEGETKRTPVSKTSSEDIVDANGNGDSTDKVSKGVVRFKVAPPQELIGVKYVRGSEDTNYISSSGHASAEVNGNGVYKLRLQNTNSIDYDQAILVDVLPHKGDYTLSSAATSGQEVENRNSDFEVKITGPVKFVDPFNENAVDLTNRAERFDVFYSYDRPQSRNDVGNYSFGKAIWKTEADIGQNWDKIKAIKIQLKEGAVIKKDSYDDFYVEFNMPGNQNLTEANQIRNSFAFSTYPSVDSLNESNIVKLKPIIYKVSGINWEDKDKDGTYTEGEKLLENTKVRLMKVNEDGSYEVAKDIEGKEYIATTDESGRYEFNVYNKGKYFVEMIRPDNYETTKNVENSDKGNHMSDNLDEENNNEYINSSSKEFDLNKNHKEKIVNGGWLKTSSPWTPITPPKTDIKVKKIWQDKDGKVIESPEEKIEVELFRDGKTTTKKLTLNAENNWSGEFKDLEVVEKLDSEKAYEYTVKEVGEENGSIKLEDKWFNVSYEGSMKDGFTITNKESKVWTPMEVPTREVKVKKEFTNFDGDKIGTPVDSIQVELYKDGEATGIKLTLSEENNWSGVFEKLPVYESLENPTAFKYTVKEVGEENGSVKLEGKWFNVSYEGSMKDGFTITNTHTPNEKPKLPRTGARMNTGIFVGALLVASGALFLLRRKRKEDEAIL